VAEPICGKFAAIPWPIVRVVLGVCGNSNVSPVGASSVPRPL
jgi:hypothetical protein